MLTLVPRTSGSAPRNGGTAYERRLYLVFVIQSVCPVRNTSRLLECYQPISKTGLTRYSLHWTRRTILFHTLTSHMLKLIYLSHPDCGAEADGLKQDSPGTARHRQQQ